MNKLILSYGVGPLLYCPAINENIVKSVVNQEFGNHYSLALCLEDTIADNFVEEAESLLIKTMKTIYKSSKEKSFYVPKIFIRVRSYKQIENLYSRLGEAEELLQGFILPKFCPENADDYISAILSVNSHSKKRVYIMPILESHALISLQERYNLLYDIKDKLDKISELVLNVRVGGNDLCHLFGFRRHVDQSIHQIRPISNIFSDIITVFGADYVISGPVWEYYNGEGWDTGLLSELKDDILNGFVGKTVIHPNQISVVNNAYKVSKTDYDDALSVLGWNNGNASLVCGSVSKERMNEFKTHFNWAKKVFALADVYGIIE